MPTLENAYAYYGVIIMQQQLTVSFCRSMFTDQVPNAAREIFEVITLVTVEEHLNKFLLRAYSDELLVKVFVVICM